MTSKWTRLFLLAVTTFMALGADCCGKWYCTAALFCGMGADACQSIGDAQAEYKAPLDTAAKHLRVAQKFLGGWDSNSGVAQNVVNELSAAKCALKDLPELSQKVQALVNLAFTAVEQTIALLVANTQVKPAPCPLETDQNALRPPFKPNPNLRNLGATKPLSPEELKKRFNALAPSAGVKPI